MKVVGVLGGIASGKSLVCRELERLGAYVLDADKLGHEVLDLPEVQATLFERWGTDVRGKDGRIDRAKVGRIVFGPPPRGPEERRFLESVTHPRISARIADRLAEIRASAARERSGQGGEVGAVDPIAAHTEDRAEDRVDAVVVLDAALLLEAGWRPFCDEILFVECPEGVRRERALARGWSEENWRAREAAQKSLEEKRQVSTGTLDNSGSSADTIGQVQDFWRRLTGVRPAESQESSDR